MAPEPWITEQNGVPPSTAMEEQRLVATNVLQCEPGRLADTEQKPEKPKAEVAEHCAPMMLALTLQLLQFVFVPTEQVEVLPEVHWRVATPPAVPTLQKLPFVLRLTLMSPGSRLAPCAALHATVSGSDR